MTVETTPLSRHPSDPATIIAMTAERPEGRHHHRAVLSYGIASLPSAPPWSTTVSPPMVRVNSSWMAYTYSPDSHAQAGLSMNGTMRMS